MATQNSQPKIPYDISYIEEYLMEGPIVEAKNYYVSFFIEAIRKFGTTAEKIKYAKRYINCKTYDFFVFKPEPTDVFKTLNLFTNENKDTEQIRKLGIFLTDIDNKYFFQFFSDRKVLPISNRKFQYPAKKHQYIKKLWIIESKPSFDCYYSSLYRMIKCYRLEQQIEERIPGITEYINDEINFIEFFKSAMCSYVDNPENETFITSLIPLSSNLQNNSHLKNITNIDNFRTSFRLKNTNRAKFYATEIEINVCCELLLGIINDNRNYVLNKTINPSQSGYNMNSHNYTGISQISPSHPPDNYLMIGKNDNNANNLFALAINKNLPFFYRNDDKVSGICMNWQGLITKSKIDEYNLAYTISSFEILTNVGNNESITGPNSGPNSGPNNMRTGIQSVIRNPTQFARITSNNTYNGFGGSYKKQSKKQSKKKLNKKNQKI